MLRHAPRNALVIILACIACAADAAAVDDRYAADPKLRRFVDSMRGETAALHLGRIIYRKRWEEPLTEALYQICGANALAVAIPCHRVVRNDGALAGYRWGIERKRALLERESRR